MKLWTDGRTTNHGHPISSPCERNGSGELKIKPVNMKMNFRLNVDKGPGLGSISQLLTFSKRFSLCAVYSLFRSPSFVFV